jgi:hypothetical protein
MKIRFKESFTSPAAEVAFGSKVYYFERAKQPFEVEDAHWPALERTGHFEAVEEEAPVSVRFGHSSSDGAPPASPDETPTPKRRRE